MPNPWASPAARLPAASCPSHLPRPLVSPTPATTTSPCTITKWRNGTSVTGSPAANSNGPPTTTSPLTSCAGSNREYAMLDLLSVCASSRSGDGRPGPCPRGRDEIALALIQLERPSSGGFGVGRSPSELQDLRKVEQRVSAIREQVGRLHEPHRFAAERLRLAQVTLAGADLRPHAAPQRLRRNVFASRDPLAHAAELLGLIVAMLGIDRLREHGGGRRQQRPLAHPLELVVAGAQPRLCLGGPAREHLHEGFVVRDGLLHPPQLVEDLVRLADESASGVEATRHRMEQPERVQRHRHGDRAAPDPLADPLAAADRLRDRGRPEDGGG